MQDIAKLLIIAGSVLFVCGVFVYFLGRIPGVGKLPGDILVKKENTTFYFPITTCIFISVVLSLVMYLWNQK